ncbi:MAG TPA: TonB-dependent receptor plug domain-containing protein [Candidatus Acidoferrales bacterium]|nr:TonB-dependent receptor plug domain-containing protein [Candidatus Acidoferrales bacterium]
MSLEQLGNVEVTTASKEPEEVWKTASAIYVITQEDIRRSGATSIPELLRMVPGAEVARIDSDHWSVGIRGFGSEFSKSVLVLIDGRSVYTPLFAGVYWDLQNVMLEDVERIEVIRGPGGTIWGANAVNGVINIITKNSKDTHGTLASVSGGNIDQGMGGFRYGGGNGKNFDFRVYGMAFGRGAEFHPDQAPFDDWQTGQGGFRTDWRLNDRDALTVQGDMYKGYDGERVQVSSYAPPSVQTIDEPHNVAGGNLLARWHRQINANSDFQLQGYYDRTSQLSPQLDEIRNTLDIDFLYHANLSDRHVLSLGAGARWSPDNITQKFATLNFLPQQETDSIYSWFLQDQISIVPERLQLTLGSKFEHNNYSGFEIQPDARLIWTPTERQSAWVAITRAVRTPSRLDQDLQLTDFLTSGPPPIFLRVAGSKTFQSEQLLSTEAGYRTLVAHRLYMDIAFFYNNYNDLYGYGPTALLVETSPPPTRLVVEVPLANATAGDTSGVEIAPDWKPTDWWELKGSYSYLHLFVHDKAGVAGPLNSLNTSSDNGSSPHHQVELQSLFNLPKRFELDTTYRYVSALPAQISTPPGQTVEAYSTADIRFGWHPFQRMEFSVVGQNLVEPHHPEFGGDDGPLVGIKRSFYAKVTWRR